MTHFEYTHKIILLNFNEIKKKINDNDSREK